MPLVLDGDLASYRNLLNGRKPGGEGAVEYKYVHPGSARTSPLVWNLMGRNTSRPWDGNVESATVKQMPPEGAEPLGDEQKRTLMEWIDLGAAWEAVLGPSDVRAEGDNRAGD
jgi:hypothetical protein